MDDGPGIKRQRVLANTNVGQQAASSKWLVGASGWRQGAYQSAMEVLFCCVVGLPEGKQPLTEGICADVLDVGEGIDDETVIKLTQKQKGI